MISKITESNKELIKARIAEINKALEAANSSTRITSLESYYANIVEIASLATGFHSAPYKYFLMPLDEPMFEIDANKRTITVPAHFAKNGVGVHGDHMAEVLYFKIDKYFDYQDLFNVDSIIINWQFRGANVSRNAELQTHTSIALAPDDTYDPGHIVFGWVLGNFIDSEGNQHYMTPSKGTLTFSVSFLKRTGDSYDYVLNTQTATVAINDSIVLEDPSALDSLAAPIFNRLSDSRFSVDNVTPLVDPVYRTGEIVENNVIVDYRGLPAFANFAIEESTGIEDSDLILQAVGYASDDGNIKYTWSGITAIGLDDTDEEDDGIPVGRDPNTPTQLSDYVLTNDVTANPHITYYDENGQALPVEDGGDPSVITVQKALDDVNISVYELGSSLNVKKAGRYAVTMQSVKEVAQGVDEAVEIKSGNVPSQTCTVPVAAVPSVILSTAGVSEEEGQYNIFDTDAASQYDAFVMSGAPKVTATVNIDKDKIYNITTNEGVYGVTADSSLGAIAFKFVEKGEEPPVLNEIQNMEFKRCVEGQSFDIVNPLEVKASKLTVIPNDSNAADCEINQNATTIEQIGSNIIIKCNLDELREFTSTAAGQGTHKWIGIDLDLGLDDGIVPAGATWGGELLDQQEEDDAINLGLGRGHIIFWAKADEIVETPRSITLGANGYEDAVLKVSVNAYVPSDEDFVEGEYCVYAINRRNHTYSISDASKELRISQIAPFLTGINVKAILDNGKLDIIKGNEKFGDATTNLVKITDTNDYARSFEVSIDDILNPEVKVSLEVRELDKEALDQGIIAFMSDEQASSLDDIPNRYQINNGQFTIVNDGGYFVIEGTTQYHGTERKTITAPFHVISDR